MEQEAAKVKTEIEVAYRIAGKSWKRKTFKTQDTFTRWHAKQLDANGERGIEIQVRY